MILQTYLDLMRLIATKGHIPHLYAMTDLIVLGCTLVYYI